MNVMTIIYNTFTIYLAYIILATVQLHKNITTVVDGSHTFPEDMVESPKTLAFIEMSQNIKN